MTQDAHLSAESMDALRARFQQQSRKAQAYYTVMDAARSIAGNDDAASAWMNEPLSNFDGKTPAQLINDGREEEMLVYVATLLRNP